MSKSPLIQYQNKYEKLPALLEDFTIYFTRALDFIDNLSEFLSSNGLRTVGIEYKAFNANISIISAGIFKIQITNQAKFITKRKCNKI